MEEGKDLLAMIESGDLHVKGLARVKVDLKEERITVRLTKEEVEAIDRQCKALGVGRSTVIRMILRKALGTTDSNAAATLAAG